jgi:hypothetical protein
MTLVNSNISSSLVRENVVNPGGPTDLVYRAPDLLTFLMAMGASRPWTGGEPVAWNYISAANGSAATFAEGEAFAVAGKQTYGRASLSPFGVQVVVEVSGRVRDQIRHGGTYGDVLRIELEKGAADLYKKLDDLLCGSTQDVGIQSVIDATDTYAGIAGSAPWASLETAVSGALTVGVLQDADESINVTPYVGNTTHWLMPRNQITNYITLIGTGATTSLVRFAPPAMGGGTYDVGMLPQGTCSFNGKPVVPIRGLTTTVILGVDMTPGSDGLPGLCLLVARDLETRQLAQTSDADHYAITMRCALKLDRRNAQIKLTGVTA